jgi:fructokinase
VKGNDVAVTILAIGEAIMDIVESESGSVGHPGGSPTNIALGLARLGEDTWLMTELGDDENGRTIRRHVEASGVKVVPASVGTHRTSTSRVRVDEAGVANYVFDLQWMLPEAMDLPDADVLHTGSIGAFVEPGATAVVEYLTAQQGRAIITFDPNIRPSVFGTYDETFARFEEFCRISSIVKFSDEDAQWLYPTLSLEDILGAVLRLGPALVVMTKGPDGAILATSAHRISVGGAQVRVVDTIGAGDSFMSALLSRVARLLERGVPIASVVDGSIFDDALLRELGSFAVRCAGITVSRAGANPPTLAELA